MLQSHMRCQNGVVWLNYGRCYLAIQTEQKYFAIPFEVLITLNILVAQDRLQIPIWPFCHSPKITFPLKAR